MLISRDWSWRIVPIHFFQLQSKFSSCNETFPTPTVNFWDFSIFRITFSRNWIFGLTSKTNWTVSNIYFQWHSSASLLRSNQNNFSRKRIGIFSFSRLTDCNMSHIIWLIYYELYRIVTKWQIINDTLALISPIPTTQYFNSAESNTVVKTKRTLFVPFYLIFFHFSGFWSFYRLFDGDSLIKWLRKWQNKWWNFHHENLTAGKGKWKLKKASSADIGSVSNPTEMLRYLERNFLRS